ncbi:ACS family hexuronate transporter-like MFS transporter [Sphingomonas vulcanisoli]|uniref:ACS family hexuronate transporter-like MFS transporter n=1 Tax=Sphingomonas vulcanisoli TaxID=1658060 RepID=A0ABX0TNN7_9SPHN|nr:MFS transporter [Sphingomonas vulcanisoli]NIJ06723.1 ACS family hexuronate transporter-like MFS transporter [Sphingomonas vulcanisoli]
MTATDEQKPAHVGRRGKIRWIVCGFLFFAVVLSYVDRLVLPVLKPDLQARYGWSESGYADLAIWFQAVYGLSYVAFGRLVDRVGARTGYAIAVVLWTIGHVAHIAFTSTRGLLIARIPLAMGEGGAFPAALAATNEWFPARERALAIGIFNAGSNVGAIVTPLIVPFIAVSFGWRMAFIATGLLTVVWLTGWLAFYRSPRQQPLVSKAELAWIGSEPADAVKPPRVPLARLLRLRQTWAYILGRFMIDPVWWTFLFWLPDFFSRRYHLKMTEFGPPLVAIYLCADVGSVAGGWFSSHLIGRGRALGRARKTAMFVAALCAVPIAFAASAPGIWTAVALIGLACAGHQAFSANLYALPGDLFPRHMVGSVVGLGGLGGALGGMLMAKFAGAILEKLGSYQPIFVAAAFAYLTALGIIQLILPGYSSAHGKNNTGNGIKS